MMLCAAADVTHTQTEKHDVFQQKVRVQNILNATMGVLLKFTATVLQSGVIFTFSGVC